MEQVDIRWLFSLLRSAIDEKKLSDNERACVALCQNELLEIAKWHDLAHLVAYALQKNDLPCNDQDEIWQAVYRYEQQKYEKEVLCRAFETAKIPFILLKGAVMRGYYPEEWMRTGCDIDILIHTEDVERAVDYLTTHHGFTSKGPTPHDVSLYSESGVHLELHFDLIEADRAQNAAFVLQSVWEHTALHPGWEYFYEMSDAYFYFYHVTHMAKHFENAGCGIRSFLDLWILERMEHADRAAREELLLQAGLSTFTARCRQLTKMWFEAGESDAVLAQMQAYVVNGGVYGTVENHIAIQQDKKKGKLGYVLGRVFIPYATLKQVYPKLEKHPWQLPFWQIRRWCKLFDPKVAKSTRSELAIVANLQKEQTDYLHTLMKNMGLL